MVTYTLLGQLALRFAKHPENLATEALSYILYRSKIAEQSLLKFVQNLGLDVPVNLKFQTQEGNTDGSIPDLVGSDLEGRKIIILEAKFWAGLTDNQPVAYIKQLPHNHDAILMFVAPSLRIGLLCKEINQRCKEAGITTNKEQKLSDELILYNIDSYHNLAILSWRALLTHIIHDLNIEGEFETISDIQQLQGLCDRMDEEAFLPLRSEELTSSTPKRLIQFCWIVDEIANQTVADKMASIDGVKTSAGLGYYSRPFKLPGFLCLLQLNFEYWAKHRYTPLWLSVRDADLKLSQKVKEALSPLEIEDPPRVIYIETEALVPLRLTLGVDRTTVINDLMQQVRELLALLKDNEEELFRQLMKSYISQADYKEKINRGELKRKAKLENDLQFEEEHPNHPLASSVVSERIDAAEKIREIIVKSPENIKEQHLNLLHKAVFDCSASVRLVIVQAIGLLSHPDSLQTLQKLYDEEEESNAVKKAAKEAIEVIKGDLKIDEGHFIRTELVYI
ncbi:MAG: hypothetical protein K9I74_14790 [Bacteroidales bacterium]|nr:hypothetical protein [Bacteroidales bacterium]